MPPTKNIVCVSTTKPSATVTPNGGGGSLTILCPQTGAILSSIRTSADLSGKTAMGMSSISKFPQTFSTSNTQLLMSFGGNSVKKGDNYAMLLSVRSSSSPPILHWKSRLPEADLTAGLLVSPCGYYVVGGGYSGSCFVWSSIGGYLLRTFKAHYRSVTCLSWSDCGRYLVTGGADGIVHMFSLIDLVDRATRKSTRTIAPLNTWSSHQFPVTCLTSLNSGRMASAAQDGQIVIVELFSKRVLATIQLPHGVACLAHHDSRLYAGSTKGGIYSIDLDAYAMHQTEKQGATLTKRQRQERQAYLDIEEKVFGKPASDDDSRIYQSEWIGHDHPVLSIAILIEGMQGRMISGDEAGAIRIWDLESRTCLNVVKPWSQTSLSDLKLDAKAKGPQTHPVTAILVMPQPPEAVAGMFASPVSQKGQSSIATLVTPLQKFSQDCEDEDAVYTSVPFLRPNRKGGNLKKWEARPMYRKRKIKQTKVAAEEPDQKETNKLQEAQERIARLEQKLEEKQTEVTRWEKVNNQLMAKLRS